MRLAEDMVPAAAVEAASIPRLVAALEQEQIHPRPLAPLIIILSAHSLVLWKRDPGLLWTRRSTHPLSAPRTPLSISPPPSPSHS